MLRAQDKYIDDFTLLPAVLRRYIPKQLLKNVEFDKCHAPHELDFVQKVLDNSNDNLRMYGSAESLLRNLKVYMDFPLRRKMFSLGVGSYYHTIPDIYQTLKKEVLYCKQDLLFYLQSCVHKELRLYGDEQILKFAELIEYMKKHEERLSGCYEFVKYDDDIFEDIRKPFLYAESLCVFPKNAEVTATFGAPQLISYEEKDFVKVFDNLISKYPCFFLSNSETKDKNATAVVRVFVDGNLKFVMESELFAAINLKNPDQKPLECMDIEGHYRTIDYKHVIERYRDKIGDIEFIYHLIPFVLHTAVPIVTPTGDHCIQALDAYMDIITETFITGIFQKITQNTSHMIPKFFGILRKYFPSNIAIVSENSIMFQLNQFQKYRFFINLKLFQKIQEELEEFWKPIEDKPGKRVRDVGPQGFTVEDLKKELKYLGYNKVFPEIIGDARGAYTIFHSQNPSELKTKDMFVVIQSAITFILIKRNPCLNEFMYRQKVCLHNRTKPCEPCSKAIKEAEERIEAEIKAESEQSSSSVTAKTSEDDIKKEVDSAELNAESVTSEALLQVKRDPENLKSPVESFVEDETKSIPAISTSEVSEHSPVLPDSNNQKTPRESCLNVTKEAEFEQASSSATATGGDAEKAEDSEESKHESVTSEAPTVAINNPVGAGTNPANSESNVPEHDTVLPDYNTHVCEKCMETSNEAREEVKQTYRKMISQAKKHNEQLELTQKAREEVVETYRKMVVLEKTLKEKDTELKMLRVYEEKSKKSDETEKKSKDLEKEAEGWKMKYFKILEENEKMKNMLKGSENLMALKVKEKNEQLKKAQKAFEEKKQRCKELEETIEKKDEEVRNLTLSEMWERENKEEYKATVKKLDSQIKLNASKSADEIKKLTAEKERAENLLKRTNKGLLEKLQKSESSLKEVTNRRIHLETEVAEKNRTILELRKSAENQVSEQEKTKKELETQISTIRGMLDAISPPESNSKEKSDTECLICLEEMRRDQKKLKCEHCRKIVHLECASEWLKNHRSCAHCRREQLDPTEFPSLR